MERKGFPIPQASKCLKKAAVLAVELHPGTSYDHHDLEIAIFDLLLSGLNEEQVRDAVADSDEADRLSITLRGKKKPQNTLLFNKVEIERYRAMERVVEEAHEEWRNLTR